MIEIVQPILVKPKIEKAIYLLWLFFAGSFMGFIWEVLVYWVQHTDSLITIIFELRGFLHGTWVPIYGVGCILIYLINKPFQSNLFSAILRSACVCSIVEYLTSWILENMFGMKLWDYSNQILNVNGRISFMSIAFFGIAGALIAKYFEPYLKKCFNSIPIYTRLFACIVLGLLFILDFVFSLLMAFQ